MRKGLFFSVPSVSVDKTLSPIVAELNRSGYRIISYNTRESAPPDGVGEFRAYPPYANGFRTSSIRRGISYFELAEMLLDTGLGLREFLRTEMEREQPDFIMHVHLAPWGKALATCYGIPGVTLHTTFVLDPRIMIPFFRTQKEEGREVNGDMRQFVRCQRKYRMLYEAFGGKCDKPDIWDAYVNREGLNLACMSRAFQEQPDVLGPEYRFIGHPNKATPREGERALIYMALGTILTDDLELLRLTVEALGRLERPCLIAIGNTLNPDTLGPMPEQVRAAPYVDQEEVLSRAAIFITMGGMASVQESVSAETPMIIIPETPEQHITARKLEGMGIATYLRRQDVTAERLSDVLRRMLRDRDAYVERIRRIRREGPADAPGKLARMHIDEYLDGSSAAAARDGRDVSVTMR